MIYIKNSKEIELMKKAGEIVYETFQRLERIIRPGVTTARLNAVAHDFIIKSGAKPSFLNYNGFPFSICTSVNQTVIHGIPNKKHLTDGDILSIDIGACYNGYHGDAARSFAVGEISQDAKSLLKVCQASFFEGIKYAKVGNRLEDISATIQDYVENAGFSVVRDFVGHGIGRKLHEEPDVPNFGTMGHGVRLQKGMALAVEPMICMGDFHVEIQKDNWTVNTIDGSLAAHYENTFIVFDDTPIITTLPEFNVL